MSSGATPEDFYSIAVPFDGGPWSVVASMPKAEIRAVTWSVGTQLAIGSLLAMLLAVGSVVWLLRSKLAPLGIWCVRPRPWAPVI